MTTMIKEFKGNIFAVNNSKKGIHEYGSFRHGRDFDEIDVTENMELVKTFELVPFTPKRYDSCYTSDGFMEEWLMYDDKNKCILFIATEERTFRAINAVYMIEEDKFIFYWTEDFDFGTFEDSYDEILDKTEFSEKN